MQVRMATSPAGAKEKYEWVKVLPMSEAPGPGTAKSVYVSDLDLCVAASSSGLLYVIGNKCPPANQPLSFSPVVGDCITDPVFGTKIDMETGEAVDWCPSFLGKVLSPIFGSAPEGPAVPVYKVRKSGENLEAYVITNAKANFESGYWTGILDAQGKADGSYY
ncbi:unnamed protein product [Discosporangium mesarthrocarpum]